MGLINIFKSAFRFSPYHLRPIEQDSEYIRYDADISSVIKSDGRSILIYVHGWMESFSSGETKVDYITKGLRKADYDDQIIGLLWGSDVGWFKSKSRARMVGRKLGNEIDEIRKENPEMEINLLAHSLGSQVILSAAKNSESRIENVISMGGGMSKKEFPTHEELRNVESVVNFYDNTDEILVLGYPFYNSSIPIGVVPVAKDSSLVTNVRLNLLHHASYYKDQSVYQKIVNIINKAEN